jgi:N-acetylglucosaminyl-diphospho-decaprenol L-rhamnosyltransferase
LEAPAPTLSVVIVAHRSISALRRTLPALVPQLGADDELIVVDNASGDGLESELAALAPKAKLIANATNAGFAAAANQGVASAAGELVVVLNPDAAPAPGFAEGIRRPVVLGYGWDMWMGLVTCDAGARVNTNGGVVHFTGVAWAGELGAPEPGTLHRPRDVGFASGACLAIPRDTFERLGGFAEEFFLYQEDVDLSLRVRLEGGTLGVATDAVVDHDYDFDRGAAKWRYLERNRWATLLRTYPIALLLLVFPALIATDLALWPAALLGGWGGQRLRALIDTLRSTPRLLGERRSVQATRTISAGAFASALTPELSSPYLGRAGRSGFLAAILRGYWSVVLRVLGA